MTWRLEGFSSDHISSAGLRDVEHSITKPPGVTRIALLGDSSTEGLQVGLNDTYARVLERMLNGGAEAKFEVINFGCSSYSTGQQLLQFQKEVLPYRPDITVLLYNRGDSLENVRDPMNKHVEPRPYFYLDARGQLQQDNAVLTANKSMFQPNLLLGFLRRNSCIYGVFSQTDLALSINERFYRKLRSWGMRLLSLCVADNNRQYAAVGYPKPDGWQVTKKLIQALRGDCKEHGSSFVLMAFPNTLGDPEFAQQLVDLAKVSQSTGFEYIDLTPMFTANPDPNSLFLKYHFSAAGHKIVAEHLAEYLSTHNLVRLIN
ncbi:MAG: SGNH/GDSL hydrolase family protein [Candidatus Melainabacteria bacterium]|nr:SGNH/GDSL hydrolase family protein [Candidatus Melainabacteria bacterium]